MERRKTFALTFFVRRTLVNAKGQSPIFMRITANGTSVEMRVQRTVALDNWSVERGLAKGRDRISREVNEFVDTLRAKALQFHRELELDRKPISARIIAKDINVPRLAQVRDIYLFCIFSGLAFTDVSTLRAEHIIKDNNGDWWIRKARQKTKNMCNIPLLEVPLALIEKYKDNPICLERGTVLPLISNQQMNTYLKELADICGIDKHLTSHTARYSFATLSLTSGISMESVAKMLGHANTRMTQHYAKILDTKINDEMNKLRGKFAI